MIFETYWIIAQRGDVLPRRFKNGLHLAEVSIQRDAVWIKHPGAVRSHKLLPVRWQLLVKTPYTGQSFGEALQQLRGKHDKGEASPGCPVPDLAGLERPTGTERALPTGSRPRNSKRGASGVSRRTVARKRH